MQVVKMICYSESDNYPCSFGGLGGWFSNGMRWKDYASKFVGDAADTLKNAEAFREYIIAHKIRNSGAWHQTANNGVPLFEDNTVATFSYRAWGDLLAAVWSTEDNKDYHYMDFYM